MMREFSQDKLKGLTIGLADLPGVAQTIANALKQSKVHPFVLWLIGDLGAGKTTFSGALLHALGVPPEVPVLSPTYTYLTEYQTDLGLCAHLDLYRMVHGDIDSVESLLSGREFKGLIVEWPQRAEGSPHLEKTHELRIEFGSNEDERIITLEPGV